MSIRKQLEGDQGPLHSPLHPDQGNGSQQRGEEVTPDDRGRPRLEVGRVEGQAEDEGRGRADEEDGAEPVE